MEKSVIADILKEYAKHGDTFYTLSHGDVTFDHVDDNLYIYVEDADGNVVKFNCYGELFHQGVRMLYPCESNRDWDDYIERHSTEIWQGNHVLFRGEQYVVSDISEGSYFLNTLNSSEGTKLECVCDKADLQKVEKFAFNQLKPFDRVLVRDSEDDSWTAALFSHISGVYFKTANPYDECVTYCIPYNDDTKKLVGTTNEAPDFYRN